MSNADAVLRTEGLSRRFGALTAVDSVNFTLPRHQLRGLIGPNGAGKTTFFHLLSGILRPSAGEIWLEGDRITDLPAHERARRGLAQSMQVESLFPSLTVVENVIGALGTDAGVPNPFSRYADDESKRERALDILKRVGLAEHAESGVSQLSHGDQKLLEVALALATDPDVLLLDEPTAGLSVEETADVAGLIEELQGDVTMVLIEHDMKLILRLVESVTVLHEGAILVEGTPDEIEENQQVQRVYMGRRA